MIATKGERTQSSGGMVGATLRTTPEQQQLDRAHVAAAESNDLVAKVWSKWDRKQSVENGKLLVAAQAEHAEKLRAVLRAYSELLRVEQVKP